MPFRAISRRVVGIPMGRGAQTPARGDPHATRRGEVFGAGRTAECGGCDA